MPIISGEPIRTIVLTGKNYILGFPFKGEYNDYGMIENIEKTLWTEFFVKKFKKCAGVCLKKGEKWERGESKLEDILKTIERGSLDYKDGYKKNQCSLIHIRESIYQAALKSVLMGKDWRGIRFAQEREEIRNKIISGLADLKRDLEKCENEEQRWMVKDLAKNNIFPRNIGGGYMIFKDLGFKDECDSNDRIVEDYIDSYLEMVTLLRFYQMTRKDMDANIQGRGSQDAEYAILMSFYETVIQECYDKRKEYEEEFCFPFQGSLEVYSTLEK
jgi:hypothetical protein